MGVELQHPMKPELKPDEAARGRFVSGIRSFILNDLAGDLRTAYDKRAAPAFARETGRPPETSNEAHKALRGDAAFNIYSAMRVQAQKMVWNAAGSVVARDIARMEAEAAKVEGASGSLTLNPDLDIPRNIDGIEVHLMPGSYTRGGDSLEAGAVYDQGLAVFSMGLMGANLDDIGLSMAAYVSGKFPDFRPEHILDTGCTIGHNTLPWKQTYPEAHVEAIDAAAGGLRYASARAKMQGQEIHFKQMSAEALDYEDASFDLVFSSMFLHELSRKARTAAFKEAYRVLKPGGLLLHMELPPNGQMNAFDGFYLDWDSWYNNEPFYKGFRDEDPKELCEKGGFDPDDYFQFVVPSIGVYGADAVTDAIADEAANAVDSETTGRLAEGIMWFGFGAWKR
ncbi:class I SAM-dependent methyltransferase [Sphingopyxis sp. BSNA05]|uniref:class I SAM-dependent methyltransferase n=1 Tax=Sphingopyxis sp. BSNA05 TaxID=1236614 RepID=UPI0015677FDC|nr:class I SAM-dependent methyltransferase [Sphingopyxis sp. BSNA05]NRD89665.1 class I SAM-dependent methyltransferase [Sphingopyxis sp. BSNA05]